MTVVIQRQGTSYQSKNPDHRKKYSFGRGERLHYNKEITELFAKGSGLFVYPYRITYRILQSPPEEVGIRMMVIVRKRDFKHAVDRNRNKRRIREAYRLNAEHLRTKVCERGLQIHLSILLISREKLEWRRAHEAIKKLLAKLLVEVEKYESPTE